MFQTFNRGRMTVSAAAILLLVAAGISHAQTVTNEKKQQTQFTRSQTSSCTGETAVIDGRQELRTRDRQEGSMTRMETRFQEWAEGTAPSGNEYRWNADSRTETRSTERTFSFRVRERTKYFCQGNCFPAPEATGDDEFFNFSLRCDVRNGIETCREEPPTFECK